MASDTRCLLVVDSVKGDEEFLTNWTLLFLGHPPLIFTVRHEIASQPTPNYSRQWLRKTGAEDHALSELSHTLQLQMGALGTRQKNKTTYNRGL